MITKMMTIMTVTICVTTTTTATTTITTADPYVKVWLMYNSRKVEKKKTAIETFIFSVPLDRIRQTSLVVSVMDYDRIDGKRPNRADHTRQQDKTLE